MNARHFVEGEKHMNHSTYLGQYPDHYHILQQRAVMASARAPKTLTSYFVGIRGAFVRWRERRGQHQHGRAVS